MTTEQRVQKGISYFKQGYNCAQSVVLAFADRYGLDEPFAAHISGSFGGGIGRMRETCGTACGMFMLAGLEVKGDYPDQELKKKNYARYIRTLKNLTLWTISTSKLSRNPLILLLSMWTNT